MTSCTENNSPWPCPGNPRRRVPARRRPGNRDRTSTPAVTGAPSAAALRSTIDPTESGTVTRTSATVGPARSVSRRAFSTASRADSRSISPDLQMAPGPDTVPAQPGPGRNQDGRQISYRHVDGLQHRPGLRHLRLPVPRPRPPAGARRPDHDAQSTRPVAGPDTPNRQNLLETSPIPTDRDPRACVADPVITDTGGAHIQGSGPSGASPLAARRSRPHHRRHVADTKPIPLQAIPPDRSRERALPI